MNIHDKYLVSILKAIQPNLGYSYRVDEEKRRICFYEKKSTGKVGISIRSHRKIEFRNYRRKDFGGWKLVFNKPIDSLIFQNCPLLEVFPYFVIFGALLGTKKISVFVIENCPCLSIEEMTKVEKVKRIQRMSKARHFL